MDASIQAGLSILACVRRRRVVRNGHRGRRSPVDDTCEVVGAVHRHDYCDGSMSYARVWASIVTLAVVACSAAVAPDQRTVRGTVTLSRADASALVTGTFKSVVDSVAVSVTGAGAPVSVGRRFGTGETSIPFSVTLSSGTATVGVQVVSNDKKTLLYAGSSTATIDHDGFSINVPLTALRPVLVVFPDTIRTDSTVVPSGVNVAFVPPIRFASVAIHNSGKDSLAWSVARVPNAPDFCGTFCAVTPASGKLAGNAN